jgi:hypothetical protein
MTPSPKFSLAVLAFCLVADAPAQAAGDLMQPYQIIESKTFVDLTQRFSPYTPAWSGFGQATFTPTYDPKTKRPYTIK